MTSARMLRKALTLCLTLAVLFSGFPVSFATPPPLMQIHLSEAVESWWWKRRPWRRPRLR